MAFFQYQHQQLSIEGVPLQAIAEQYGTPCYVYARAALEAQWLQFDKAFADRSHQVCYAVKANSNIAILNVLARLNSGFDIVSQGELERVLVAKGDPKKIIFSGVGKTVEEITRALAVGIMCFNVESMPELLRIHAIAKQQGCVAPISLRINPNIDARTHSYISTGLEENKFGIDHETVFALRTQLMHLPHLQVVGLACHIGSQLTELAPFAQAIDSMMELAALLIKEGMPLAHLNFGGGLGVCYQAETPPSIDDYVTLLRTKTQQCSQKIVLEPGRAIVAQAGLLLTKIEYIKSTRVKNFAIVDAGMNDLLRPALYSAWHAIYPLQQRTNVAERVYDVVGPVCESADFIGKNRTLTVQAGDFLAIAGAGAYGFAMSSNYNSRPRAAEVLVDNGKIYVIRRRELWHDLFKNEQLLPLS